MYETFHYEEPIKLNGEHNFSTPYVVETGFTPTNGAEAFASTPETPRADNVHHIGSSALQGLEQQLTADDDEQVAA